MNCGLPCLPLKYWVGEVKILTAQCCLAWKSEYEYHLYKRLLIQTFLYSTLCDLWQKYPKKFAVVKTWKYYSVPHQNFSWNNLKVVSATFLLVWFFMSRRSHFWNKEDCFLFHRERYFCSWDNQILTFQILKHHDVIKCPSMKHETHFIE